MYDIILLHALFGSSIPISKLLLRFVSPILLVGIRMTLAGFLLIGFNIVCKRTSLEMKRTCWWQYAQIIVVGVYLKYMLRSWGLAHMSAIKMVFLLNISPFVSAYFSYVVFHERLTRKQWIGMMVGVLGSIPILCTSSIAEGVWGEFFYISWPELAIIAAVMAHCYGLIVSRILIREYGHSASLMNGVRMLGGGILALMTAFCVEPLQISSPDRFWGWLAIQMVVSNMICYSFYLSLLKRYTVTFISLTDFLTPLFVMLYSWAFLHETITWHYGVSVAIILLGIYLFYADEMQTI